MDLTYIYHHINLEKNKQLLKLKVKIIQSNENSLYLKIKIL